MTTGVRQATGSVRKKPGSRYWYACYTMPSGRQKQVSSKSEDRLVALELAIKLQRASNEARDGVMTEDRAQRLVREIRQAAGDSSGSLEPAIPLLLQWRDREIRGKSVHDSSKTRMAINSLIEFLPQNALLGAITRQQIVKWRDRARDEGLSVETVNSRVGKVIQCFREFVVTGLLEKNPAEGLRLPKKKGQAQQRKIFSESQVNELLSATEGEEWHGLILMGRFQGKRLREIADLQWEQIDLEKGAITFLITKRAGNRVDRQTVPMHRRVRAYLQSLPRDGSCVFPRLHAMPNHTRGGLSGQFRTEILPRIGIVQPYRKNAGKARQIAPYSFHSLRHTFNTRATEAGIGDKVKMMLSGHEDVSISNDYTRVEFAAMRKAMDQMEEGDNS